MWLGGKDEVGPARRRSQPTRRVGRPRADPRPRAAPPEEEILAVAGRLFARKGFAGTSTREIAAAAGLRQPSLFHYYPKKEEILRALLERTTSPVVDFAERLRGEEGTPAEQLFRLFHFDVRTLLAAPYDVAALARLPEVRPPRFRRFWRERASILAAFEALIGEGVRCRELVSVLLAATS